MSTQLLPVGAPLLVEPSTRPALRAVDRHAPARRKPRDLWRPIAGQSVLFDPNVPTQLALFGDDVPVDVLAEGKL